MNIAAAKWEEVPLGSVCRVIPGYAFKSKDWCDEGIPVIKIKNIQSDRSVDTNDADCVPESIYSDRLKKFLLEDGDILLAMTGATAGKVGKLRTKQPMLLNQRVAKIKPVEADPEFIWAIVSSDEYQDKFFHLADGAAQPNMSGGQIERLTINLPDLPTQRKIAGILSAYDDLIENNLRRIKILEEMAQALYREWFVHFRFPGHEADPLVDSSLGPIPKGWAVRRLDDISENFDRKRKPISKSKRAERQGIHPYYGAAKIFDYLDDYIFDGEYLLMAEDGSVITPDQKPVLQLATGKFWANNHTHILRGTTVSTHFLYLALLEVNVSGYITGAAQPKITQANMNRIPFVCGPASLHERFDCLVEPLVRMWQTLDRRNENLRRTRDLLLPKLLQSG
jgi:type I restriction enzyme S subunit